MKDQRWTGLAIGDIAGSRRASYNPRVTRLRAAPEPEAECEEARAGPPGVGGGAALKRPVRSLAILIAAMASAACDSENSPKAAPGPPAPAQASVPKSPGPEAPVRDMKPADIRADEPKPAGKPEDSKAVDEPPPLVPPAGAKDERPDATKPK